VRDPALQPESGIERHCLGAAPAAAIPPASQLHLADERHQAPRGSPVGDEAAPAGGAGDRSRQRPLEPADELGPEGLPDLRQGGGHAVLEGADVGMLEREMHLDGAIHSIVSPSGWWRYDNTTSVPKGLTPCRARHRR